MCKPTHIAASWQEQVYIRKRKTYADREGKPYTVLYKAKTDIYHPYNAPFKFSLPCPIHYRTNGAWHVCRNNAAWFRKKFSYNMPFGIVAYADCGKNGRVVVQHAVRHGKERSLYTPERSREEYIAVILLVKEDDRWARKDYFLL